MELWIYPTKIWQWPLFVIGFILFWILLPLWIYKSKYTWKENAAFVILHWQAIFYNPWLLKELWG
jgi:hypothetical protein